MRNQASKSDDLAYEPELEIANFAHQHWRQIFGILIRSVDYLEADFHFFHQRTIEPYCFFRVHSSLPSFSAGVSHALNRNVCTQMSFVRSNTLCAHYQDAQPLNS